MKMRSLMLAVFVSGLAVNGFAQAEGGAGVRSAPSPDSDYRPKIKRKRPAAKPPVRAQKTAAQYEADADRYFNNKDYDNALDNYESAVKLKPSARSLYQIGWIHNEFEEYAEALPYLDRALALNSQYSAAYREKGYALKHLNRNQEAVSQYNRALQIKPDDSIALFGLGDVYYSGTKEYQKAIDNYRKGLSYDGTNSTAAYNSGWAYNELGQYNNAIRMLDQATTIKSDYAEAFAEKGYAYKQLDRTTEAINAYQQAIDINPQYSTALYGLGDVYYDKEKNYELAAEKYKAALAIKPDNFNALYRLGYCYNDLGQNANAIQPLTRAKQLKPSVAYVYNELGYAYLQLKRHAEAAATIKQAIAIESNNEIAHYYLGQVYLAQSNRSGAMAEYQTLQSLNSQYASKLYQMINR